MKIKNQGLSPILILVITVFIDMTGYGIIIPLLPFYVESFQAGPTALGILIASFAIMQFFFSPLIGAASDKFGRKPILLFSLFISLISFTLFSFANSYLILLLSRIIAGIATERAVAQAYIADVTDKKTRAKELGKIGAGLGAGFILGPAIGGVLSTFGFSVPGYAAMLLTITNIIFVFYFLPESNRIKNNLVKKTKSTLSYGQGILKTLRTPLFGPTLLILFIITFAFSAIPVIVPILTIEFYNFSSLELSYLFIYIGLIQIFLQGFLIGKLVARAGEEKLIIAGPMLMGIGIFLMPIFESLSLFFVASALMATGFGMVNTAIPALISKKTQLEEQGRVLGVAGSVVSIANIPGPLLGGLIIDFLGLSAPFLIAAFMLIISVILGCRVYGECKLAIESRKLKNNSI